METRKEYTDKYFGVFRSLFCKITVTFIYKIVSEGGVGCMPVQLTFFFHSMPVVKLCLVMQLSATGIYSGKKKFSVQKLNRNLCRLLSLKTFMFTTTLWIVKNKCAIVYVCV